MEKKKEPFINQALRPELAKLPQKLEEDAIKAMQELINDAISSRQVAPNAIKVAGIIRGIKRIKDSKDRIDKSVKEVKDVIDTISSGRSVWDTDLPDSPDFDFEGSLSKQYEDIIAKLDASKE